MRTQPSLRVSVLALALAGYTTAVNAQRHGMTLAYQLTHVDQGEPFFSPDGTEVVHETIVAGVEQIFIMNADGSSPSQITRDAANHDSPAWSPDGGRIAFVSDEGGGSSIFVMNLDGTEPTRMTRDGRRYLHPTWSPDGSKLLFCTDDDLAPPRKNASDIVALDLETGRMTTLIEGGTNTYPSWSPDGRRIVFRRMLGEMDSEVFVADGDGSNAHNLTNHPAFDGWPSWSPDGTQIVFASNRRANYQIFVMNADGSDVRLVANTEGRSTEPRWAPDGRSIYFTNCRKVDWGVDCEIFVAELGAGTPSQR